MVIDIMIKKMKKMYVVSCIESTTASSFKELKIFTLGVSGNLTLFGWLVN
jgi:hypothetical protein